MLSDVRPVIFLWRVAIGVFIDPTWSEGIWSADAVSALTGAQLNSMKQSRASRAPATVETRRRRPPQERGFWVWI
jgi:hypothetical protein